jgi:hypothetical protein
MAVIKRSARILLVLIFACGCFADTFTNLQSGETFNGYVVHKKKGNKVQVRIENRDPQYIDLSQYKIERNALGRKNKVYIFPIKDSIELICETDAFEKAIEAAVNQGPLYIILDIDTPGGQIDLAKRVCSAITQIDNCTTVAFISGGKLGGAFSAGAVIAMACDKVYMLDGTSIGAASLYAQTASGPEDLQEAYGQSVADKFNSAWSAYFAAVAELRDRPGQLAKAMVDKDVEVVEVIVDGNSVFIDAKNKKEKQQVVKVWNSKGSLLTLTADNAVKSGIANGKVASREKFFAAVGAANAGQIQDKSVLKAKQDFERAKKEFDRILDSIRYLEQRMSTLLKQFNTPEEQFRQFQKALQQQGLVDRDGRVISYAEVEIERKRLMTEREGLIKELLSTLDGLMANYRNALAMATKYPDLGGYVGGLQKGLTSAQAAYDEIRFQASLPQSRY